MLTIGHGRSRGLGQVQIRTVLPAAPTLPRLDDLVTQVEAFSQRVRAVRNDGEAWAYLPVTLESDMIVRDRYLLPCSSGDPHETLFRYQPPPADLSMRLVTAVQRTGWIGGWDALRGLPRPFHLVVQHGSVWVYQVPADMAQVRAALTWWIQAEQAGLGERRDEGFGRIRLLHPLHREEQTL